MKFEDWFNEIELYSMRSERFFNDLEHHVTTSSGSAKRMIEWLRAAYDVGYQQGKDDTY